MTSHARQRLAFTSVEVLAATLLASAMMVTVLGVLSGIAKREAQLAGSIERPDWHDNITNRLTTDLRQAGRFRREQERLILVGEGLGSSGDGTPNWLPAEVHYYPLTMKDRSVLVRQEFATDGIAASPRAAELLLWGTGRLELFADLAGVEDPERTREGSAESALLEEGTLPPRLRVVVLPADEQNAFPLYDQALVLY